MNCVKNFCWINEDSDTFLICCTRISLWKSYPMYKYLTCWLNQLLITSCNLQASIQHLESTIQGVPAGYNHVELVSDCLGFLPGKRAPVAPPNTNENHTQYGNTKSNKPSHNSLHFRASFAREHSGCGRINIISRFFGSGTRFE